MEISKEQQFQYKNILINTLIAFDNFCSKHNIRYFATGGTAIGAVRHKGVIPWDDDIDVVMIREDYDRFLSIKKELNGSSYRVIDPSDIGYYLPFAKFVDINTTIWETCEHEFLLGVYIDIFPLNHVTGNLKSIKEFQNKYLLSCRKHFGGYKKLFTKEVIKYTLSHPSIISSWLERLFIYKPFKRYYSRKFWEYENLLKESKGDYLLNYYTQYKMEKELFNPKWFDDLIRLPFEDTEINMMAGYHDFLTQLFGDYMTPPPTDKQVTHHSCYFMDLKKRWTINEIKAVLNRR